MTTLQYIDPKDAGLLCAHCQRRKDEHRPVNFADGPRVDQPTLICPTSVFQERRPPSREAAARARAEDSR